MTNYITIRERDECLGVGPGGISGFWYLLSTLKKMDYSGEYVCASSGCLSIVSKDLSVNDVYHLAKNRDNFSYTKNTFIHSIVNKIIKVPDVTILTMDTFGTCHFRKPRNKRELETLLIVTTNVPFMTRFNKEFDGGLCFYMYNNCINSIKLPIRKRFIEKLLDTNMTLDDLIYFYNYI
tara:strand:- start:7764 stop:8300 length:537 start_codon:yes stop_codon:yes gene_type:complete